MSELPKGWFETTLGTVAEMVMGQAPPGSDCNKEGIGTPFVKTGEFGNSYPEIVEWTTRPLKFASRGDVLICVVGATCGKLNRGVDCAIGRSVAAIRPSGALQSEFLYAFMETRTANLRGGSTGSAQGVISKATLQDEIIPLPPLVEQRRIVEKLDALCAQSRAAGAALNRIETLTTRYKAAVLAAAFSGEHTYVSFEEVIDDGPSNGWSPAEGTGPNQTFSLKLSATTSGRFIFNDATTKTIPEAPAGHSKFWLQVGDILIQRANSLEYVGTAAEVDHLPEASIYPDLMMRVRIKDPILRKLMVFYLNSAPAKAFFRDNATGTAGNMPKISGRTVKQLPVPLPPPEEQAELVERIEAAFAQIDTLTRAVTAACARLKSLDRAVLVKAFRGELVPQDPYDEPASDLLKRLTTRGHTHA